MSAARPLGRVLRGAEWGLYSDAAEALAVARNQADRLREAQAQASREEAERLRAATLEAAQAQATRLLAETSAGVRRQLADVRIGVAEAIAISVARVIGETDIAEAVARAAVVAVAGLQERHGVTVLVAPQCVAAVRERLSGADLVVVADAALSADDCVVQTEAGFVQAGLQTQVAALREALLRAAA